MSSLHIQRTGGFLKTIHVKLPYLSITQHLWSAMRIVPSEPPQVFLQTNTAKISIPIGQNLHKNRDSISKLPKRCMHICKNLQNLQLTPECLALLALFPAFFTTVSARINNNDLNDKVN